jgi:arginyl-tRNA synthetase
LSEFEDCLVKTIEENDPALLASFSLELAKLFSKAYLELKVIDVEKEIASERLSLFEATAHTLKLSLNLLGIKTLLRM